MANTSTSKTYKNLRKGRKDMISKFENIQDKAIVIAEELVDLGVETSGKYQKIATKAIKKGQPLLNKQMDIIFDSIEEMKAQYDNSTKRFLKVLGIEKQTKQLKKDVEKRFISIKKTVGETVADISDKVENVSLRKADKEIKQTAAKKISAAKKSIKKLNINDLTIVNGIGPKLAQILKKAGVKSLNDLIKTDVKTLKDILKNAGPRYASYNPTTWVKEAKKALLAK